MEKETDQIKTWKDKFGKEYTDRNPQTIEELESLYQKNIGITRSKINQDFLGDLNKSIRILEVGSNVGTQLMLLQKMGFNNLYGIELQEYAVEVSKSRTKNINLIQGSAFDIPYKDEFFDLVFTSGVLIHISPKDIQIALKEIHRCSKKYIWGYEYYADKYTEIVYRGHKNLLWKTNFAQLYLDNFTDLTLIKEEKYKYLENENVDSMFLLKKN